jgi:beta-glucosidase
MIQVTHHFPRGFLWGTATSSHQVEGDNRNNDWWEWEQQRGRILLDHKSGKACDWWGGRWKGDLDRAAELGQNAHRLSLEWSRVEPDPAIWDETAIDRYRQIIKGALARGLMPMVTLHHFSNPRWISERGGWLNPDIVAMFERYTRKVVSALHDVVGLWVTINEPSVLFFNGYIDGRWPPGERDIRMAFKVIRNIVRAHAAAYYAIHDLHPGSLVGLAHHYRGFKPANPRNPLQRRVTRMRHNAFNAVFPRVLDKGSVQFLIWRDQIPEAVGTQDFFGLNYYTLESSVFNPLRPMSAFEPGVFMESADLSPSGHIANEPDGFWEALKWAKRFALPIYITENGVDDAEDEFRPRYLAAHIHKMWRAVNYNWPIRGYFHWSLVDNFEWERGWTQRFGLWELNVETQARIKRKSADLYAEICQVNGLSSEMVAVYAPEIMDDLFPPKGPVELL